MSTLRKALLLNWHGNGCSRPRYGRVDDAQLILHGRATFICDDGQSIAAERLDVVLLDDAGSRISASPTRMTVPSSTPSASR